MTDEEVEVVAEELAKVGGTSWYPGRAPGPLTKLVTERYRDRARVAIAAFDRFRAQESSFSQDNAKAVLRGSNDSPPPSPVDVVRPGATVIYRPAGERRAYPCCIVKLHGDRAYLKPIVRACTGWVSVETLRPARTKTVSEND